MRCINHTPQGGTNKGNAAGGTLLVDQGMLKPLTPHIIPYEQDIRLMAAIKLSPKTRVTCDFHPYTAIVAGRGSKLEKEINIGQAIVDDIPILRRLGGGCSVVLDPGNLVVSSVFPARGFLNIQPLFQKSIEWLIRGLKSMGVNNVYTDGISDLVINNKKIGGTCFYRVKGIAYFSASILVNADLALHDKYLRFPPRQPSYRQDRLHMDFVENMNRFLGEINQDRFADELYQILCKSKSFLND